MHRSAGKVHRLCHVVDATYEDRAAEFGASHGLQSQVDMSIAGERYLIVLCQHDSTAAAYAGRLARWRDCVERDIAAGWEKKRARSSCAHASANKVQRCSSVCPSPVQAYLMVSHYNQDCCDVYAAPQCAC